MSKPIDRLFLVLICLLLGVATPAVLVPVISFSPGIQSNPIAMVATATPAQDENSDAGAYRDEYITVTLTIPTQTKRLVFENDVAVIEISYDKYVRRITFHSLKILAKSRISW